jgi:CRP-like cAMP-binding protein
MRESPYRQAIPLLRSYAHQDHARGTAVMSPTAAVRNASLCTLCPLQTACVSELAGCINVTRLNRGQHLCRPGDDADFVYIVREGALKTYGSFEF